MPQNTYNMNTTNLTRKILKKIRHCKAQHNKYLITNPELAKEYFWKIDRLKTQLNSLNNPKPIQIYKREKRMGVISKKPKFKKKRIDHSIEFQKRKLNREMPMLMNNLLYKYAKHQFDKKVVENEEIYAARRLEVMFKLAKDI